MPLMQNAVVTTDKQLKPAPDQVKRTIKASIEALQFIREHPGGIHQHRGQVVEATTSPSRARPLKITCRATAPTALCPIRRCAI